MCFCAHTQQHTPVGDVAVADALHVSKASVAEQAVLAGVEWQQQVTHAVGVVDGLTENCALFLLNALLLLLFAQRGPQTTLLRRQLQCNQLLLTPNAIPVLKEAEVKCKV